MLTITDIKELLVSREPVIYHARISAQYSDIECAYISAVITRYDPKTRKYENTVELMDRNNNAVYVAHLSEVRRKTEAAGNEK